MRNRGVAMNGATGVAKPPLQQLLQERILILDGAMGTMIQQAGLSAADFGGDALEGCNEMLNLTRPDVIRGIHEAYLEAGADIIETNTFGATSVVLAEYGIADRAREINLAAVRLAREACDRFRPPENRAMWRVPWGPRRRPCPSPEA